MRFARVLSQLKTAYSYVALSCVWLIEAASRDLLWRKQLQAISTRAASINVRRVCYATK
jgi:hypothetical protein